MYSVRHHIIALISLMALVTVPSQPVRADERTQYALMLDGAFVGILTSFEGGVISGEVVEEPAGPTYYRKKHLGQVRYEDITISFGTGMQPLYNWVKAGLGANYQRKSGSIFKLVDGTAVSETEFLNALITEIRFPGVNSAGLQDTFITLKFAPELIRYKPASGNLVGDLRNQLHQTTGLSDANFRLTIGGLDVSQVIKTDGLVVKQTLTTEAIGEARDYLKEPGNLSFPNLVLYIKEDSSSAESFRAWHKNFVIDGNVDESNEKSGSLEYFVPGSGAPVLRLNFFNLGIFRIGVESAANGGTSLLKAQMYCERIELP